MTTIIGRKTYRRGDKGFYWVMAGLTLAFILIFGGAIGAVVLVVWKLFTISVWWGIAGIVAFLAFRSIRINQ